MKSSRERRMASYKRGPDDTKKEIDIWCDESPAYRKVVGEIRDALRGLDNRRGVTPEYAVSPSLGDYATD